MTPPKYTLMSNLASFGRLFRLFIFTVRWRLGLLDRQKRGRDLAVMLSKMGVLYVKVGQVLSVQYAVFDEAVTRELRVLQRNVRPDHNEDVSYLLRRGITEVDPVPFASGSVASVYRGRLGDRELAIKVVRSDAMGEYHEAVGFLRALSKIAPWIPGLKRYNIPDVAGMLIETMGQQVDMANELENWRLMHETYGLTGRLIVPFVHEGLCDERTLVMDYVHGLDADAVASAVSADPPLMTKIGGDVARFMFESTLFDRVYHGDAHPGNIFWREGDFKLGMYDFGIVRRLSKPMSHRILRFYVHLFFGHVDETCDSLVRLMCDGAVDETLRRRLSDAFDRHAAGRRGIHLVNAIQDVIIESHAPINNDMSFTNLNIIVVDNMLNNIREGFDAVGEMRRCLREAIADGRIDIDEVVGA
jgi:ubiquinone biosynthesis protein